MKNVFRVFCEEFANHQQHRHPIFPSYCLAPFLLSFGTFACRRLSFSELSYIHDYEAILENILNFGGRIPVSPTVYLQINLVFYGCKHNHIFFIILIIIIFFKTSSKPPPLFSCSKKSMKNNANL